MKYCKECVYPYAAENLMIDDEGVCRAVNHLKLLNKLVRKHGKRKKKKLIEIIEPIAHKNTSNYDCLIPVSGGKDSYFQIHCIVKDLGLKPLLVTYDGNNFLPEGAYNRDRMRLNFDADHITWAPSIDVLKKLNRLGFKKWEYELAQPLWNYFHINCRKI